MSEEKNRQILDEYVRAIQNEDLDTIYGFIDDNYIEEYPQSGERIRGKENFRKMYDNFPGLPSVEGYNIYCCGDLGIVEMLLDYPDGGTYNACQILHFRNGKMVHTRMYFGQPFEAADWRSEWVEMMGEEPEENYETRQPPRQ